MGVLSVAVLAGCGAATEAGSEVTLASWRDAACTSMKSFAKAEAESAPITDEDDPLGFPSDSAARQLESMQGMLVVLRKIPLPTEETDRADVERLLELFATVVENYERAVPRIEAASRRLERVLKAAVADETALPPPPEGSTVAGGIMSQMMSMPGVSDAFDDYMAAIDDATSGNEAEAERLEKRLGLEQCEVGESPEDLPSAAELDRCASRGKPVSVQLLVDVFSANGLTLALNERTCAMSVQERSGAASPDATNAGPTGLSQSDEVERREGFVLCHVDDSGGDDELYVNKYPTDTETRFSVHNVSCTLYPHSTATEAKQVARVKEAMQAVARANR